MPMDCFGARARLQVGPAPWGLDAADAIAGLRRFPSFVKVLLCHADAATVTQTPVDALARWTPRAVGTRGSPSPRPIPAGVCAPSARNRRAISTEADNARRCPSTAARSVRSPTTPSSRRSRPRGGLAASRRRWARRGLP